MLQEHIFFRDQGDPACMGLKGCQTLQIEFCQKDDGGELWTPGIMWIRCPVAAHQRVQWIMVVNGFNACLFERSTCSLYWVRACELGLSKKFHRNFGIFRQFLISQNASIFQLYTHRILPTTGK